MAGFGAVLFYYLIDFVTGSLLVDVAGLTLPSEGTAIASQLTWSSSFPRILLVPVLLGLGGLAVGLISSRLAPEVAGHGTDATIRAFHHNDGKVRIRVPILKTIASAITLGTGGSGGREGPVSQIGGGFGSLWADLVKLGDRDRRIALATGMGAGIGAIFRAPLGGAVYSAEILYTGDFEPEVFVPSIIASVVSYSIYSSVLGFHTLFATPVALASYAFDPRRLPLYAVLGIVCGATGIVFTAMYHRSDAWFATRRWPLAARPAIGAGIAGAIFLGAYFLLPQQAHFASLSSLSVGYGFVQAAMLGQLSSGQFTVAVVGLLIAAVLLRMVMTSLVVGSGGSAGLFGTSVVVGAFLGTALGGAFHTLLPGLVPLPVVAVFSIVGMMSFFGGISKAPLGVLIMVLEMAGSYTILPAAMLSIFVAYVVTGNTHIYSEQLPSRIQSPAHRQEYRTYFLSEIPIGSIALQDSERVPPSLSVREALDLALRHGHAMLSVEQEGEWFGGVRLTQLVAVPIDQRDELRCIDLARPLDLVLSSNLPSLEALRRMDERGVDVAGVISVEGPVRMIGLVTRRGIRHPTLDAASAVRP
ncbi:MAG: chloride channel protein [Thermoplasmata archaeon]|nr:chloride channel protein [Thermoplasmata archaeon]